MKHYLILLFILFIHLPAISQIVGYKPIVDIQNFKRKLAEVSAKTESLESPFTQTKTLQMLNDKLQSNGRFSYKKENKVRIEYIKPYYYLMILNNGKMTIKDEHKTTNMNTQNNKLVQAINSVMLDCMRGTVYNNKDFETNVFENNKEYAMELIPKTSLTKKMFSKINVFLDKGELQVTRLTITENGGDNTQMNFIKPIRNTLTSDAPFVVK